MTRKARRNYINAISQRINRKKMYKSRKQWVVASMSILVLASLSGISLNNVSASTIHHPRISNIRRNHHATRKHVTKRSHRSRKSNRKQNLHKIHHINHKNRHNRYNIKRYNRKLKRVKHSRRRINRHRRAHNVMVLHYNNKKGKRNQKILRNKKEQKQAIKMVHVDAKKIHKEILHHIERAPQSTSALKYEEAYNAPTVSHINYTPLNGNTSDGTYWKPVSGQAYQYGWRPQNSYNGHVGGLTNYDVYDGTDYHDTTSDRLQVYGGPYNVHFEEAYDPTHIIISDVNNGRDFNDPADVQNLWVKVNATTPSDSTYSGWLKASDLGSEFTTVFGQNASDLVPKNGYIPSFTKTNYVNFVDSDNRTVATDTMSNLPVGATYSVTPPDNYKFSDGSTSKDVTMRPVDGFTHYLHVKLQKTNEYITYVYKRRDGSSDVIGNDTETGIIGSSGNVTGNGLNPNYHIASDQDTSFTFTNNGSMTVLVNPNIENTTIHYKVGNSSGTEVGSHTYSGAYGNSMDVTSKNDSGLPGGYYLQSDDNGSYYYDNGSHDVIVEPKKIHEHINYVDEQPSDKDSINNFYNHKAGSDSFTYNDSRDSQIGNNSMSLSSISKPNVSRDYYMIHNPQTFSHQAGNNQSIDVSDTVSIKHKTANLNVNLVNYRYNGHSNVLTDSSHNGNKPIKLFTHPQHTYTLSAVKSEIENMHTPIKVGLPNNKINWSQPIESTEADSTSSTDIPVLNYENIKYYSKSNNKTFNVTEYGIKDTPLDINSYPYGLPHGYILSGNAPNATFNGGTVKVNVEPYDVEGQINKTNKNLSDLNNNLKNNIEKNFNAENNKFNHSINSLNQQISKSILPTIHKDDSKNSANMNNLLNKINKEEKALNEALAKKSNKQDINGKIGNLNKSINQLNISKSDKKSLEAMLRRMRASMDRRANKMSASMARQAKKMSALRLPKNHKNIYNIHSVSQLNRLREGRIGRIDGMDVAKVDDRGYFEQRRWLKLYKTIPIYSNILLNHRSGRLHPSQALPAKGIRHVFILYGKYGTYVRYEIQIGKYDYFLSGHAKNITNAYIQNKDLRGRHTIKTTRKVAVYNSTKYNDKTKVKTIKPGTTIHVRSLVYIGHRNYEQTRFKISSHRFITANKNYVRLI